MVTLRRFEPADAPTLWALNNLPNVGTTADADVPLPLPPADGPPASFADLADIGGSFLGRGGEFLVAERGGHLVGMGGILPSGAATRRRGVGRALMAGRERQPGWSWTLVYYTKELGRD